MSPSPSKVTLLSRKPLYKGYLRVESLALQVEQFQGGMGPDVTREVIERGRAVAVLPYDPVLDQVVLIEQFRPGVYAAGVSHPWMTEIVAGIIEPGEELEDVARRECQEECRLSPRKLERIAEVFVSPGVLTETVTLYCGWVDAKGANGYGGLAQEGEDIRIFTLPAADFIHNMHQAVYTNACLVIAAQWFALNHSNLRTMWRAL